MTTSLHCPPAADDTAQPKPPASTAATFLAPADGTGTAPGLTTGHATQSMIQATAHRFRNGVAEPVSRAPGELAHAAADTGRHTFDMRHPPSTACIRDETPT